jgi:hypothetical protein
MSVNKKRHSRILLLPLFLGISLANFSVPAQGMDKLIALMKDPEFVSNALTISPLFFSNAGSLIPLAQGALELSSQSMQNSKFGRENVSEKLLDLVSDVMTELKLSEHIKIIVKKMNPQSVCMIAQEYQFVGVHPTNGTLYLDEEYLKTQTPEDQKTLIKSALLHYMNNSYTKLTTSHYLTAAVCGYLTSKSYQWGYGAITSIIKDALGPDLNSPTESFFSTTGLAKGISSFFISAFILGTTQYVLNKTIKKPLQKKLVESCHHSIQNGMSDIERKYLEEQRKICDFEEILQAAEKRVSEIDPKQAFTLVLALGGEIEKYKKLNPNLVQQIQNLIDTVLIPKYNNTIKKQ